MKPEFAELLRRIAALEERILSPSLNPQFKATLVTEIGIRSGSVAPTHTPDKETEIWIVSDGVDIRLWAWAAGAWHFEILT